jgi:hypothetical protein
MCLFWSMCTMLVLRRYGIPAQLQAGTAQWRMIALEDDDGMCATHFGHVFELTAETMSSLLQGRTPEWHVWCAVAGSDPQIIDLTSRFFKLRAIEEGHKWTAADPPQYLWSGPKDMPAGAFYEPNHKAIELAYQFMKSAISSEPLVLTF